MRRMKNGMWSAFGGGKPWGEHAGGHKEGLIGLNLDCYGTTELEKDVSKGRCCPQ